MPLDAQLVRAAHLGDCLLHVPHRYDGKGDEATGEGVGVLLDLKVVEGADGLESVLLVVVGIAERAPGDAGDVAKEGVHVHAVLVHRSDACRGDVGDVGDLFPALGCLGPVRQGAVDDGDAGLVPGLAVDEPGVMLAVDRLEVGDLVAPLARHPVGPRVGGLLKVIVGRDHVVLHHALPV